MFPWSSTTNEQAAVNSALNKGSQTSDCEKVRVDVMSPGGHSKLTYGHWGSHREVSANGQSRGWLNGDAVDVGVGVNSLCDMTRQHNTSNWRMVCRSNTFIVVRTECRMICYSESTRCRWFRLDTGYGACQSMVFIRKYIPQSSRRLGEHILGVLQALGYFRPVDYKWDLAITTFISASIFHIIHGCNWDL